MGSGAASESGGDTSGNATPAAGAPGPAATALGSRLWRLEGGFVKPRVPLVPLVVGAES